MNKYSLPSSAKRVPQRGIAEIIPGIVGKPNIHTTASRGPLKRANRKRSAPVGRSRFGKQAMRGNVTSRVCTGGRRPIASQSFNVDGSPRPVHPKMHHGDRVHLVDEVLRFFLPRPPLWRQNGVAKPHAMKVRRQPLRQPADQALCRIDRHAGKIGKAGHEECFCGHGKVIIRSRPIQEWQLSQRVIDQACATPKSNLALHPKRARHPRNLRVRDK